MNQVQNDEIDLLSIIETLWEDRWKIIVFIFISLMAGISYVSFTPNSFKVTTKLQQSKINLYHKYKYLNELLEIDYQYDPVENLSDPNREQFQFNLEQNISSDEIRKFNKEFKIDRTLIFEMFINEFNDYEEMISVLSENGFVKDKIKNLNDKDKRKALINFAKNFIIIKSNDKFGQISFLWHEVSEGIFLFNKALKLTLINVQKSLITEINNIAYSVDFANQRKKASLNIALNSIRTLNKSKRIKRIRYLMEQSDIAKELGIEKNQLDKLTIESPNYPYYLRGFKAIDKEVDLIKSRSKEDNDLMSNGYLDIKAKLILIEKDIRSKQLRDTNKYIMNDDLSKWISFNLELAEIENTKKPYIYIIFSIIIGGILGTFYVLIAEVFRKRKNI